MIDSHTHLDLCSAPPAELVQDASANGVSRIVTVGITAEASRAALDMADEFEPVYVAAGCHPKHRPTPATTALGIDTS